MLSSERELRVLVVEDEPADAELIAELLARPRRGRCALRHVSRVSDAERVLEERTTDVVLLDLGLPDVIGLEGVERIARAAPTVPMVVLSGREDDDTAMAALHGGAEDYLVKGSFDEALLRRTIRYALERHRSRLALAELTDDLRVTNARLAQLAQLDPLTELFNRRGLQEILSHECGRAKRSGLELLVILVDLDDFKQINDRFGHSVGDVVLSQVSTKLKSAVRVSDYIGRIGGDEFLVVLPDTPAKDALRLAERVRLAISEAAISFAKGTLRVTASLGVARCAPSAPVIDELLSRMHLVLRESKRGGKNRVSLDWEPTREGHTRRFQSLVSALDQPGTLRSLKQPICELPERRVVGYELLTRCQIEHFETPDDFFRSCMEANLLTVVDHGCLRSSLASTARIDPAMRCHVNVFPSTLIDVPIQHLLEEFPAGPAGRFCVEISEAQILGNPAHLVPAVTALREAGIRIAVDDVGFGRSCLENLLYLGPDIVKVDKSLTIGLATGTERRRALERLLKMLRSLEAEVVVEGIETEEELSILLGMGVRFGQGFLLGRPA